MKYLDLTDGGKAMVDDDVWEWARHLKWGRHYRGTNQVCAASISLPGAILGTYGRQFAININQNTLDCRRENLAVADVSQRNATHKKGQRTATMYKGVDPRRSGKYAANIRVKNKKVHLGTFACEEDAARAYDAKAREAFGEFATLNFPSEGERGAL